MRKARGEDAVGEEDEALEDGKMGAEVVSLEKKLKGSVIDERAMGADERVEGKGG